MKLLKVIAQGAILLACWIVEERFSKGMEELDIPQEYLFSEDNERVTAPRPIHIGMRFWKWKLVINY